MFRLLLKIYVVNWQGGEISVGEQPIMLMQKLIYCTLYFVRIRVLGLFLSWYLRIDMMTLKYDVSIIRWIKKINNGRLSLY